MRRMDLIADLRAQKIVPPQIAYHAARNEFIDKLVDKLQRRERMSYMEFFYTLRTAYPNAVCNHLDWMKWRECLQ